MSLDVYLKAKEPFKKKESSGIFIRKEGKTVEIPEEEWNRLNPGKIPVKFIPDEKETRDLFHANITHNLNKMADEAGLYEALWNPESLKVKIARDLIIKLSTGLVKLKSDPERFKKLNPENGWGTYEGLVEFVEKYLIACVKNQDAEVEIDK